MLQKHSTRGILVVGIGNPRAVAAGSRATSQRHDLNRCFPPELPSSVERASYEHIRAEEIRPILARSDILVDIHATNQPCDRAFIFALGANSPRSTRELLVF